MTLRNIELNQGNLTLQSLSAVAQQNDRTLGVLFFPDRCASASSSVAVSMNVITDGFESWKIHFFELVDEFRRTLDPRLTLLPPVSQLDARLRALLSSIALDLANEAEMDPPDWAQKPYFLDLPWFPAGAESLKASALVESPVFYRKNNIFVLENFLRRT